MAALTVGKSRYDRVWYDAVYCTKTMVCFEAIFLKSKKFEKGFFRRGIRVARFLAVFFAWVQRLGVRPTVKWDELVQKSKTEKGKRCEEKKSEDGTRYTSMGEMA